MGARGPGLGPYRRRQLTAFRHLSTDRPRARYGGPAEALGSNPRAREPEGHAAPTANEP